MTEATPHRAYPGCYALSKVLEETLLPQTHIQYGLNVTCLRAPWIMEKDDFRYFFRSAMTCSAARTGRRSCPRRSPSAAGSKGPFPCCATRTGRPLKRNFVHVDDLVDAILAALDNPATKGKLYNIAMDEPVDYAAVAAHLKATRGLGSIDIPSAYHSNWLDNTRAKLDLNWRPRYRPGLAHRRRVGLQTRPRRSTKGLVSGLRRRINVNKRQ